MDAMGAQTQFQPPLPGLYGWGTNYKPEPNNHWPFFIIDRLQVPLDLPTGDYVLSWRWDCEQGAQVWTTCGGPLATAATATIDATCFAAVPLCPP